MVYLSLSLNSLSPNFEILKVLRLASGSQVLKINLERFLLFFLPYNYGSCDRIVTWWSSGNFWKGVSYGFYRLSIPVNRAVEIG